jgi:hypothetical protein
MKGTTSNAVEGQAANETDDGVDDEYDRIVPEAVEETLKTWRQKKQAELDDVEDNTSERRKFLIASECLKPTDIAWACEFMSHLKKRVGFIERSGQRHKR